MHGEDYQALKEICEEKRLSSSRPSVMDELKRRREQTIEKLNDIDAAIILFEKQPDLEAALTSIGRLGINI